MEKAVSAIALPGYKIQVTFSDGLTGVVDLTDRLFGPVFEPLKDPESFGQVGVDEFGAVCWPNGADLAPDALYAKIASATKSDRSASG